MQKFNFSYEKRTNDLFLYSPNSQSKGSIEFGDLILDFNTDKQLVGIQFMNATTFLEQATNHTTHTTIANILSNLKECKVDINHQKNVLFIKIYLIGENEEISQVFSLPTITTPSPAIV